MSQMRFQTDTFVWQDERLKREVNCEGTESDFLKATFFQQMGEISPVSPGEGNLVQQVAIFDSGPPRFQAAWCIWFAKLVTLEML